MSTHYNHLSEEKRILLSMMLQRGYSKSKIAANLGVNRSTVYREIKRNSWKAPASGNVYYTPMHAQKKYTLRQKRCSRVLQDEKLRSYIEEKLQLGWSPWQIEGRLKLANQGRCVVSHETIYRYIYSDNYKRNKLHKKLRRRHFNRVQRGKRKKRIPEEMRISHRPENINNREEFGHWECDLMIFKHGIKGNLITLRERKTRYMLAIKNNDKTATGTAPTLISTIKTLKSSIKSITFDQGSEFQKYPWIKDCLEADIYFCEPASPYQKGSIENGNGVLRVDIPRDFDVNELRQKELNGIVSNINNRPLKCLNYYSPRELFLKQVKVSHENSHQ